MAKQRIVLYKDAGVSIDEADVAVSSIRGMARSTFSSSVLTDIGSFGGGYLLKGYKKPVLVSSADGVGTKLKLAFMTGKHSTIGEDLFRVAVVWIAAAQIGNAAGYVNAAQYGAMLVIGLLGASLFITFMALMSSLKVIPNWADPNVTLPPSWQFVNLCWQSVFVFLPLMVAYNASKKLGCTPRAET